MATATTTVPITVNAAPATPTAAVLRNGASGIRNPSARSRISVS